MNVFNKPDSTTIDYGAIPTSIIPWQFTLQDDDIVKSLEAIAIQYSTTPNCNKCIINFFKLLYGIFQKYKVNDRVLSLDLNSLGFHINHVYLEFQDVFKTCAWSHDNVLEARMCSLCNKRMGDRLIEKMNALHTGLWQPPLLFGVALSYLIHFMLGLWYDCICIPFQDNDPEYNSDIENLVDV